MALICILGFVLLALLIGLVQAVCYVYADLSKDDSSY